MYYTKNQWNEMFNFIFQTEQKSTSGRKCKKSGINSQPERERRSLISMKLAQRAAFKQIVNFAPSPLETTVLIVLMLVQDKTKQTFPLIHKKQKRLANSLSS